MFIEENPNPNGGNTGDCVVRAICIAENMPWKDVYMDLCMTGLDLGDMPSSNRVWGAYLKDKGYERGVVVDMCPHCYTVTQWHQWQRWSGKRSAILGAVIFCKPYAVWMLNAHGVLWTN